MNILSLYNGISCGRVAFDRAKIKINRYVSYEIDKYANQVAKDNFPNDEYNDDVTTADFTQYKGFDFVIGGSPCTHWSIAKRGRETTSEGLGWELFKHFVRAVKETKCKYFIYENNNSIHKDIKDAITNELGVEPIMINSALVSAQQRKRCYWTNIPNVQQPDDKNILLEDILESGLPYQNKAHTLTASYNGAVIWNTLERSQRSMIFEPVRLGKIGKGGQGERVYSVIGKSVCLSANGGGRGAKTGLYKVNIPDGDYVVRKLTPIEAERLQTLPDNYTKSVSNTQRYKCLGNGWTIDVIVHILSYLSNK